MRKKETFPRQKYRPLYSLPLLKWATLIDLSSHSFFSFSLLEIPKRRRNRTQHDRVVPNGQNQPCSCGPHGPPVPQRQSFFSNVFYLPERGFLPLHWFVDQPGSSLLILSQPLLPMVWLASVFLGMTMKPNDNETHTWVSAQTRFDFDGEYSNWLGTNSGSGIIRLF